MSSLQTLLPIFGMTCASCASAVEKALLRTDGVLEASVNLASERASVTYDDRRADLRELVEAIDRSGYQVTTSQVTLPIGGMTCASCAAHVQGALEDAAGVVEAQVNLATEKATVAYIPGLADLETLRQAVEATGYQVLDQEVTADQAAAEIKSERKMERAR
ncbi:MAG: heavy metal-associated domain-containing protein [Anaerolineales bacterium]